MTVLQSLNTLQDNLVEELSNNLSSDIIEFHNIVNRIAKFHNETREESLNRLIRTMKIEPKDILNDEDKYKIEVLMSK